MKRLSVKKLIVYVVLIFGAVFMVFPFFWMFSAAFKTSQEINKFPPQWLPSHLSLENFRIAVEKAPFARYFLNSLVVTCSCVLLTGVTTILASFAFSRLKFRGRDPLFSLLLSMMMIPFEMIVITNYAPIVHIGLYDSLPALILPFTSSLFS